MRRTCLRSLYDLACRDDRVVFIGSDITKRDLEKLSEQFPERFFLEGIYEQHIVGMAAGMALEGKMPYVNTIATFLTRRCYEQILLDVGLHNLPVRLIGSGGGLVYAPLGSTHLANEDMAILRAIPNMTIVAACDREEMARLMPKTLEWDGPIYIRLAKGKGDAIVSSDRHPFEIGKAIPLREGGDVLFVTTGITTQRGLVAAEELERRGISAAVLHVHTVKPLDEESILGRAQQAKVVVTAEEHTRIGGLGSAVAELLMDANAASNLRFARIALPDAFTDDFGSQNDIMAKYGVTAENMAATAVELLNG